MPFVYNVTVGVDKDIETEWLQWMRATHIPDVMKTGMFTHHKIYKVLTHDENEPTVSYAIQYFSESIGLVQEYLEKFAPKLREEGQAKFGSKQVAYRTLLEDC